MIEIQRCPNGVSVTGHAGYAELGQDIVCSAVSALFQTLVKSLENLTEDNIQYDMQPGAAYLNFGILSERGEVLVESFFIGVEMIADEYPYSVQIV